MVGGRLDIVDGVRCSRWKTSFLLFKKINGGFILNIQK